MQYFFYFFALISLVSAAYVVSARSPVNSVIALIICFLSIAGHYILLNAQFLAMVHVIVYTGAIMVLFLFVIMLLNLNTVGGLRKSVATRIAAATSGGLLFLTLVAAVRQGITVAPQVGALDGSVGLVKSVGICLFNDFLLPFEVSSVLFLSAMVGAMMLAKRERPSDLPKPYTGNELVGATPPTMDPSNTQGSR
ncbi:MAG: NADH-quinone oxidoreductase subunit J [Flavobacteriales bacterium]|nr:NADH-quinone oxidoreductase subunit J [Flavobacteriales bacterium]MBK6944150.1 NADH-quinone oxidoreductase subunit J [Flavobacteriales bacterium]MBK7240351.1 NADH-quinone oxidoreductase subunit J [Flavobacteriales bacterium]MBK7295355.1 NADH-quinone oxidoreductase subunit J [Flavobacteriales bacterium]MBP9137102.1 NADH-quinone oxidoreductase subunit J [Flavobacteriales bacterium]